jgi:hypothetical protein
MEQLGSLWTYLPEILIPIFLENLSRKFKFDGNLTRIAGILPDDICTF